MLKRLGLVLLFLGIGNYSFSQSVSFIPNGSLTGVTSSGSSTTFTVPLLLPNGSATAPSLSFSTANSGGIFKGSSYGFTVTSGTTSTFEFNNTVLQAGSSGYFAWSSGAIGAASDLYLTRDAANTLALRNSTNAQTFNIYNSFTTAGSNYGMFSIAATATGTDLKGVGVGATAASGAFRSLQGSTSKTLTESSATSFTQVAVPQTAGANHAAGKIIYEVYATDGTDSQSLTGEVYFSAVNKAGTETCSIGLVGTEILAVSAVSTLTCTHTCVTGLVDAIQIASNCVSSLVQTTFTIQSRLDMPQPNTVTPQ